MGLPVVVMLCAGYGNCTYPSRYLSFSLLLLYWEFMIYELCGGIFLNVFVLADASIICGHVSICVQLPNGSWAKIWKFLAASSGSPSSPLFNAPGVADVESKIIISDVNSPQICLKFAELDNTHFPNNSNS
jgi:hypothetical protein